MTVSCRSTAMPLLLVLLAMSSCGQPTAEPVGSGPKSVGETIAAKRSAPPSVQAKSAPPAQPVTVAVPTTDHDAHAHQAVETAQWEQWYATARDSPDVSVRLQALETWAQRPGDQLDPVTYGLVDQDDSVRRRAQELYEQQLAREAAGAASTGMNQTHDASPTP